MAVISCTDCGELLDDKQSLVLHQDEFHPVLKPFKCTICSKRFKIKQYLKDHMRVHTGERPYACDICEKAFKSQSHRRRHVAALHLSQDTNEACPDCGKCFRNKAALRRHSVLHSGQRPFRCTICEKSFAFRSTLVNHKRVHMTEDERYRFRCVKCGRVYAKVFNLEMHVAKCAGVPEHRPEYPCQLCPHAFNSQAELNDHLAAHSMESEFNLRRNIPHASQQPPNSPGSPTRPNSPPVVSPENPGRDVSDDDDVSTDTEFSSTKNDVTETKTAANARQRSVASPVVIVLSSSDDDDDVIMINSEKNRNVGVNLDNDITVHRKDNGKSTARQQSRKPIEVQKHLKCEVCSARFLMESELRNHAKRHTKPRHYSCPDCDKSYTKPSHLKIHSYKHSGKFPFSCPFCSRGFSCKYKLRRHLNQHRNEPKENCVICEKSFPDHTSLARHMRNTHKRSDHPAGNSRNQGEGSGNSRNKGEGSAINLRKSDGTEDQIPHPPKRSSCDAGRSPEDEGSDSELGTDTGGNQSGGDLAVGGGSNGDGASSDDDDRDTDVGSLEEETGSYVLKSVKEKHRVTSPEKERNFSINESTEDDLYSDDNYLTIRSPKLVSKNGNSAKGAEIPNRPNHSNSTDPSTEYFIASGGTFGDGDGKSGTVLGEYFSSGVKRNFNYDSTEGAKEQKPLPSSLNEIDNNVDAPIDDVIEKVKVTAGQPKLEYVSRQIKTETSSSEEYVEHSRQRAGKTENVCFTKKCITDDKMESALLSEKYSKDFNLKRLHIRITRLRTDLVADLIKSKEDLKLEADIKPSPHRVSAFLHRIMSVHPPTMRIPTPDEGISDQLKSKTENNALPSATEGFLLPDLEADSEERKRKLEYMDDVKEKLLRETRI